jgi:hypothetical protein
MPWNFLEKTEFLPTPDGSGVQDPKRDFTPQEKADILAVMQRAYVSPTAKSMFNNWLGDPENNQDTGKKIKFIFSYNERGLAKNNQGIVYLDPATINTRIHINPNGEAVKRSLLHLVIHELIHALMPGMLDPELVQNPFTDITGNTTRHGNQILSELELDSERMASYLGQDYAERGKSNLELGYQYTNNVQIDAAYVRDINRFSTASLTPIKGKPSNDLLVGGPSANDFESGAGDDFLYGLGGNDTLNGGDGKDTAGFYGTKDSYKFGKDKDGKWTVSDNFGAKEYGIDTLENIEFAMFDDVITAPNGTTLPTKRKVALLEGQDIVLAIDLTRSMDDLQ